MKAKGRPLSITKEAIENAIQEYLTTDKSAKEVAATLGVTQATFLYHYHKQRKEQSVLNE